MSILDHYVRTAPHPRNAIAIFKGTWSARLPVLLADIPAGSVPSFEDARIPWAAEQLGGFEGKNVLELGPLEGAQTYLLEQHGAAEILAIEANTLAYLKCLVIKELLDIRHARYLCGDFLPFLRANERRFDVAIASGVLYHMRNPAELLGLLAHTTDRLFLWTHYYDAEPIARRPDLAARHSGQGVPSEYRGFKHTLYRQEYQASLGWGGFCGGSAPYSNWMTRDDILAALGFFGFDQLCVSFEDREHLGGPSFAVAAVRTRPELRPERVADSPGDTDEQDANSAPLSEDDELWNPQVHALRQELDDLRHQLQQQDAYIARVEETLAEKNAHIARLEALIQGYESGRAMWLLRRLRLR
jgi:hypothetical protein